MSTADIIAKRFTYYTNHLQHLLNSRDWNDQHVEVKPGRKFYKVVVRSKNGSGHVHSFVDKQTGDIYKAASWAQPAKGVRYNLLNDLDTLQTVMDVYGSYLYKV